MCELEEKATTMREALMKSSRKEACCLSRACINHAVQVATSRLESRDKAASTIKSTCQRFMAQMDVQSLMLAQRPTKAVLCLQSRMQSFLAKQHIEVKAFLAHCSSIPWGVSQRLVVVTFQFSVP